MQSTLLLRVAAVLSLLLGVGHTIGRPWIPVKDDPLASAVVVAMKAHQMHVMGFDRTFMDFYVGFGWMLSVYLFLQAVLLWMVAGLVRSEPGQARAMTAVFLAANLALTVIAGAYLFTAPLILTAAVTLCLGGAVAAKR